MSQKDLLGLSQKILVDSLGRQYLFVQFLGAGSLVSVYEVQIHGDLLDTPQVIKIFNPLEATRDPTGQNNSVAESLETYEKIKIWGAETPFLPRIFEIPIKLTLNGKDYTGFTMERFEYTLGELLTAEKAELTPQKRLDGVVSVLFHFLENLLPQIIFLHEKGVFNPDLKANNVMLRSDNFVSMTDFDVLLPIHQTDSEGQLRRNDFSAFAKLIIQNIFEAGQEKDSNQFSQFETLSVTESLTRPDMGLFKPLTEQEETIINVFMLQHDSVIDIQQILDLAKEHLSAPLKSKYLALEIFALSFLKGDDAEQLSSLRRFLKNSDPDSLEMELLHPLFGLTKKFGDTLVDCRRKLQFSPSSPSNFLTSRKF